MCLSKDQVCRERMNPVPKLFITLLMTSTFFTLPAHAQSKKELSAVDAQLAQRLKTLEGRMLTGDPAAERLMPVSYTHLTLPTIYSV